MKIDADQMEISAAQAEALLKAMANRHRLMLLCQLIEGERSVGDLVELLGLKWPAVSQHLSLLRKDGLVSARREGQTIWYAVASPPAREILFTLYRYYCADARCPSDETATDKARIGSKGQKA